MIIYINFYNFNYINVFFFFFFLGKRRCPGDILAKATIFILFVGIMQKYTLLPVPGKGSHSIKINSGITLTPQPYNVLVEKR